MKLLYSSFHKIFLLLVIIMFPATVILLSQGAGTADPPLFQSDEILDITISMDIREVLKDIGDDRSQHSAELSYLSAEGQMVKVPVKVRTRGHFRRDPMNCNFPPLRLNFSEPQVANSIFKGQDKIKLVAHCRSRGEQYEQNVLEEYLAYKLYNLFTDYSYKVRLANFSYADSKAKRDTVYKMGFLLEPTWQMSSRLKCTLIEIKNVQQGQCDPQMTTMMSVFQYMIGNTDWSIPVPHNIDLIQEKPGIAPVPVPYDFDWCGLVDAPYAIPAENLGISDVKTRIYRGLCREEQDFERVFQVFRDKREEVFHTIESLPLNEKDMENVLRYIGQFYSILADPELIKVEFLDACRTP